MIMYHEGLETGEAMTMTRTAAILALLPVWIWPGPAAGQAAPPQPVTWVMEVDQPASGFKAGGTFDASIIVKIDEGWHVYAVEEMPGGPQPLRIALAEQSPFGAGGPLRAPTATREMDESFGQVTASYTDKTTFRLPIAAPVALAAGPHDLAVDVAFQACNGQLCLPSRKTVLKTTLTITN
jgi:DsbC/DsbD-like thiol-disulfide interchange protein